MQTNANNMPTQLDALAKQLKAVLNRRRSKRAKKSSPIYFNGVRFSVDRNCSLAAIEQFIESLPHDRPCIVAKERCEGKYSACLCLSNQPIDGLKIWLQT